LNECGSKLLFKKSGKLPREVRNPAAVRRALVSMLDSVGYISEVEAAASVKVMLSSPAGRLRR